MRNDYDCIVIGAGIGGLICAGYLSRAGLKVAIFEKNGNLGGCMSSFKRKGFTFDAGAHLLGSCGNWEAIGKMFNELSAKTKFKRIDPADTLIVDGQHFDIPADFYLFESKLAEIFADEKDAIKAFFSDIKKIWRRTIVWNMTDDLVVPYINKTYKGLLDERFKDKRLKSILSFQYPYVGSSFDELASLPFILMMASYLKDGSYYPAAGIDGLIFGIEKGITGLGCDIYKKSGVNKIIIKDGRAKGVVTESGQEFYAPVIISNIDAKKTFYDLVGKDALSPDFCVILDGLKESGSFFLLYLGLRCDDDFVKGKRGFYYKSYEFSGTENCPILVFIPTLYSDSIAPQGCHIIHVVVSAGFNDSTWSENNKTLFEANILKELNSIFGDIESKIIIKESASPKSIERFTANSLGASYGWANVAPQSMTNRLNNVTCIENLFLVGHWTQPGSGVAACALSGYNMAMYILNKNLKKSQTAKEGKDGRQSSVSYRGQPGYRRGDS